MMAYVSGQYHLTDLLTDVLRDLGSLQYFTATGGTTTTAVNTSTNLTDTSLSGTIFIKDTTDGGAPIGEYQEITSFVPSTGTFTFSAMTVTVEAGDVFGYANPRYPVAQVIEHCNRGLSKLGMLPVTDTTTLTTATDQTEYAASIEWKYHVFRIDLQTDDDDANDNRWVRLHNWEFIPASAGSTGLIVFHQNPPSDYALRVWSWQRHPRVDAYDDPINEAVHPDLAIAACVEETLRYQNSLTNGEDDFLLQLWNSSREELAEMKRRHPIVSRRTGGGLTIPRPSDVPITGEPNKVRL